MKLIVGLGNPGDTYINTRHNAGFMVVDGLKEKLAPKTPWKKEHKHNALVVKTQFKDIPLLLAKPLTFMNNSGEAVASLVRMHKIASHDIVVLHDDLDLPLGIVKVKKDGGSAGHNGISSITEKLGTDSFLRVRLGIGRPEIVEEYEKNAQVINFVLDSFAPLEIPQVNSMIQNALTICLSLVEHGYDLYMGKFNARK